MKGFLYMAPLKDDGWSHLLQRGFSWWRVWKQHSEKCLTVCHPQGEQTASQMEPAECWRGWERRSSSWLLHSLGNSGEEGVTEKQTPLFFTHRQGGGTTRQGWVAGRQEAMLARGTAMRLTASRSHLTSGRKSKAR